MQLLANVAGRDRVLTVPEASDRISTACDKLPLALRIAGARRSTRPGVAMTMLAERLEDERGRVEELAFGDMSMHHRLSQSYRALDPVACSAFRALGSSGASLFTDATAEQLLGLRRTAIDRGYGGPRAPQSVDVGHCTGAQHGALVKNSFRYRMPFSGLRGVASGC